MTTFIDAINAAIQEHRPGSRGLSRTQRWWLGICLMGIMVTNSVCWARFERATLGCYSLAALAWMFRHAKVPWELLLQMSVQVLLKRYGITAGVLVVDDSDKRRAKVSRRLAHVLGPFNRAVYRTRNRIERLINRCKQFRRLAIRYEKRAVNYRAMWLIAVCLLWL